MNARMSSPAEVLPDAIRPMLALLNSAKNGSVPELTLELVHLRASQINGCGYCVVAGAGAARKAGATEEQLMAVAAWRDAPYFTDEQRVALALAEETTRIADRADAVPDAVWDAAADHFDEKQLASILLMVGVSNLFNRLNVATRQPA